MKRVCLFLAFALLLGCVSPVLAVAAEGEAPAAVISTNAAALFKTQGTNGWYYYMYTGGKLTELEWDAANNKWKRPGNGTSDYPSVTANYIGPGHNGEDLNIRYISNKQGLARLKWSVNPFYTGAENGNGVIMSVYKSGKELWNQQIAHGKTAAFEMEVSLRKGEAVDFRINGNGSAAYDITRGFPVVEYLAGDFALDFGGKTFFQKNESGIKELQYNEQKECFVADDEIGVIGLDGVMPSDRYSMVMRYVVTEDGRYRVFGEVNPVDPKGDGTIIKVYKNDEMLRQWYFPAGKEGAIDFRLLAKEGDVIDVEASIRNYVGHNYTEWSMDVSKVPSVIGNSIASTVLGSAAGVLSETLLSDYLGYNKPDNVRIYTTLYGIPYDMEYNLAQQRWQLNEKYVRQDNINASNGRVPLEEMVDQNAVDDNNYVSKTQIKTSSNPTSNATTYIELPITKDGTIMVDGEVKVSSSSKDGELVKVYLNDKVLWSNRLGEEASNRYDEPYENKFFLKDVHAVANVKAGDTLKFSFNRWRFAYSGEYIDISDIKIKYIVGDVLSENTRWLLENSLIVDTLDKSMYINGKKQSADVYIENGTTYLSANSVKDLLGNTATLDGKDYIPLRSVAESLGKNVLWTAGRLVIIHDGIDGAFTYNELSEIEVKVETKGGDLFD